MKKKKTYDIQFCSCGRIHVMSFDEIEWLSEDYKNRSIIRACANCGKAIIGHSAISRKDNKTEICSNCGTLEALEIFKKYQREVKDENWNNNRNKWSKYRNKVNS